MTILTDGILFYGFSLGTTGDAPWLEEGQERSDDWIDILLAKLGVNAPRLPYEVERAEQFKEYWRAQREVKDQLGCDIGYHCADGCAIPYVYLLKYEYTAYRGSVIAIPSELPKPTPEDINQLKEFCRLLGINWQEPSWKLASWCE